MLSLVGDPCAINPDARLRAHAKAHGLADPRLPHRPQGRPGWAVAAAVAGAASGRSPPARVRRRRYAAPCGRPVPPGCDPVPGSAPTMTLRQPRWCSARTTAMTCAPPRHGTRLDDLRAARRSARCLGPAPTAGARRRSAVRRRSATGRAVAGGAAAGARARRLRPAAPRRTSEAEPHPADRAGRAGPRRRQRGVRAALRPLPTSVYRFVYYRIGSHHARRGPHLRDVLAGAARHDWLPLAGQGLRRLADDHRPQPGRRPLQVGALPARADHRGHARRTTSATEGPENEVLARLTNEVLLEASSSCQPSSRTA